MGKVFFGGIVGSIIVLIWGFISWAILPWHDVVFEKFQNETFVASVIKENVQKDGVYIIPSMNMAQAHLTPDAIKEALLEEKEALKQGPFVYAQVKLAGRDPSSAVTYITSFLTQFVGAMFICWLLLQAKDLSYFGRLYFVTIVGLVVGILAFIPNWNWLGAPLNFTLVMVADMLISWFLAGIILAAFVKHRREKELPL
jgi:hypothetical protein